jgi:hypothetical protein
VVALVAAGDLEEGALAPICIGLSSQVRCGAERRRRKAAAARSPDNRRRTVDTADAGIVDLGDEIAFAHAGLDRLDDALVHRSTMRPALRM